MTDRPDNENRRNLTGTRVGRRKSFLTYRSPALSYAAVLCVVGVALVVDGTSAGAIAIVLGVVVFMLDRRAELKDEGARTGLQ